MELTQSDIEDDVISGVAHGEQKHVLNNSGDTPTPEVVYWIDI